MADNKGSLFGKTIFITGASRGIGKAIALKAAKDGANIVIAAKTAQPHPKLPGTIYTAAKEVEDAGGKCLPCVVDVRSEEDVRKAVKEAVDRFGGIDILVNNASAISLQGTEDLPMKKYDLMNQINGRGTYLCSHICIPYLKRSSNPHILNISPPLNMNVRWFKNHVAYTMAKYNMSLCVLGMAEEFKGDGIAVNALWPKTTVYTAATNIGGGKAVAPFCRKTDIMADAAYVILTKDSRTYSGNFAIDEDVFKTVGVTDLDHYAVSPGNKLRLDIFIDDEESSVSNEHAAIFQILKSVLNKDLVKNTGAIYQFDIRGTHPGMWYLDLKNGDGSFGQGSSPDAANCEMTMDSNTFLNILKGELAVSTAYLIGEMKIRGDIGLSSKLQQVFSIMKSKL